MVRGNVPILEPAVTVKVEELVLVVGAIANELEIASDCGLKLALPSSGNPLTLKLIVPLKAPTGPALMMYVATPAGVTICGVGVAAKEKSGLLACGVLVTTSITDVVRSEPPLVPVMVSRYSPRGVAPFVATAIVETSPVVTRGVKLATVPLGSPMTRSDTGSGRPRGGVKVIEYVVLVP